MYIKGSVYLKQKRMFSQKPHLIKRLALAELALFIVMRRKISPKKWHCEALKSFQFTVFCYIHWTLFESTPT